MNDTCEIFQGIEVKTSRGLVTHVWGDTAGEVGNIEFPVEGMEIPVDGMAFSMSTLVETIEADVQPKTLTQYELASYGLNEAVPNTKVMFYFGDNTNLVTGNRVRVNGTEWMEIRGKNAWPSHTHVLLVPIVGIG